MIRVYRYGMLRKVQTAKSKVSGTSRRSQDPVRATVTNRVTPSETTKLTGSHYVRVYPERREGQSSLL